MQATVIAVGICAGVALLEGVAAGRGVRARFAELRLPPFSPPLPVWIGIGLAYYVACFVILLRLLNVDPTNAHRVIALGTLIAIMLMNAAWGFLFFRLKDIRASYFAFFPYGALVFLLGALLVPIDLVSAFVLLPYLLYLAYATWWGHALWRLNDVASPGREGAAKPT
jgi:benzodiazapine receptor